MISFSEEQIVGEYSGSHCTDIMREIIVGYWFRTLISYDISIDSISKIIISFSQIYEQFVDHDSHGGEMVTIDSDGKVLSCKYQAGYTAMGSIVTANGYKYHWTLKIIAMEYDIYTGITDIAKNWDYTYAWWSYGGLRRREEGQVNNNYANDEGYGENHTVHIWLDLSDDKRELSFGRNDQDFGKAFDVTSTQYKLAILIYGTTELEIIDFEITK